MNKYIKHSIVKGFTIVELAIVLVVIGIILSMVVKGKALVRVARIKADIVKIDKMRTAINIVYAKRNGGWPDLLPKNPPMIPEIVDKEKLFAEGILSRSDMHSDMVNLNWNMILCATDPHEPYHYTYEQYTYPSADPGVRDGVSFQVSVCATFDLSTTPGQWSTGVEPEYFCYYEHALDDDNFTTGYGKHMSHRLNTYKPGPAAFEDCGSMSKEKMLWMYRLI